VVARSDGPLLEGRGLTKRYGHLDVLSGADFVVAPGITGLLGANGAGKTTLLGILLGLRAPTAGEVRVFGLDPSRAGPSVRARIGYAPEHQLLPGDVRANDFVRHIAEVHGLPTRAAIERASDALWWVGLGEERFRELGTLSTGQRQRVKLAMAIAHDPTVVLLDEPTDGLDPTQRESMLDLIRRIGHEFGISVLLSSHLLEEVERTCDRVLMLAGGRVVASGGIDELRGEATGIVVELDTDPSDVASRLRAAGCDVEVDGRRLTVEPSAESNGAGSNSAGSTSAGSTSDLSRLVRDTVADSGVGIRRLGPRVVTLEDVFLEVDR
jgi:ABC-2 type transport system ATP-binding protein